MGVLRGVHDDVHERVHDDVHVRTAQPKARARASRFSPSTCATPTCRRNCGWVNSPAKDGRPRLREQSCDSKFANSPRQRSETTIGSAH